MTDNQKRALLHVAFSAAAAGATALVAVAGSLSLPLWALPMVVAIGGALASFFRAKADE